jgi:DNA-binding transcriptional ArsR family regulator
MLNDSRLNHAFAALSDPTRRAMLSRLSRGSASVSELAKPLSMSLPAVLQHLRALETSGLVRSEKFGRVRTVRLEPGVLSEAEGWLTDRRNEWEARADRLEQYLETMKKEENGNG